MKFDLANVFIFLTPKDTKVFHVITMLDVPKYLFVNQLTCALPLEMKKAPHLGVDECHKSLGTKI